MNFLTSTFFRRILLLLLPFTALVVYVYSKTIVSSMYAAENRTVQEYLRSEYARFERHYANTGSTNLPSSDFLSAWWAGEAGLPEEFAEIDSGMHALNRSRHLLVAEPEGAGGRRVFFVLSEPEFGSPQMVRSEMESTIYLTGAIVFVSGAFLAVIIARLVSGPIRALANDVRAGPKPGEKLREHSRNDEIGVLSRAIGDLVSRMDCALDREKSVTRYASHDMRTPVAVIRTALSVLQFPECDDDKRESNLRRIDEACAEIKDRIEVHLCLARESAELPEDDCDIRTMIEAEITKHRHTVRARSLDVTIAGGDITVRTARSMLRVVLGNLIQNAVNYSSRSIDIAIGTEGFAIRNSSGDADAQENRDGMGIEIVRRVCDRMNWRFHCGRSDNEFSAEIAFQSNGKRG